MNLEELIKSNTVEDYCILNNEELSNKLDVSLSTIKRGLNTLKDKGIISIEGNRKARKIRVHQSTSSLGSVTVEIVNNEEERELNKRADLGRIDEKYHEVFNTDWNAGSRSTMDSYNRNRILQLFYEFHSTHDEIPMVEGRKEILKEEVGDKLIELNNETKELINSL